MGFINNITGGGASGGTTSNSVSSKIVDELKVDVAVVETKVNSLPFDITGVKVDKNFDLNNFVVKNVPIPTASNQIANKGYVETWIKKDGVGNINAEGKKIINVVGPSSSDSGGAVANKGYVDTSITTSQTFVINDVASKYLDKKTGGTMSGGINMDNKNIFGLQNPPKFRTSATSKDYVHNHVKIFLAASIVEQNGLVKDSNDKFKIDLSIARSTIASVLPTGGVERDGAGKLKLDVPTAQTLVAPVLANGSIIKDGSGKLSVDLLSSGGLLKDGTGKIYSDPVYITNHLMQNGLNDSYVEYLFKSEAVGHWKVSDNSTRHIVTYADLDGGDVVNTLFYQSFGRVDMVKLLDFERPTTTTSLITNKYNYITFDGVDDKMKAAVSLDAVGDDKTVSITIVYRLTAEGKSDFGLRNALIGNDNTGWDKSISMTDVGDLVVGSADVEPTSHNGGQNIVISTFPTNADATLLNNWIVLTVNWASHLGVNGSAVFCNGKKLRTFTAVENPGAPDVYIGTLGSGGTIAPLTGDIAEIIIFKELALINTDLNVFRIHKHLLEKYEITHDPILSL